MAKLTQDPYPMPDLSDYDDHDAYFEDEKEAVENIEDPIIRFPRADGYALYRVVDFEYVEQCECCGRGGEPLLQHVPYLDAYRAAGETIKGLTTEDARRRAEQ